MPPQHSPGAGVIHVRCLGPPFSIPGPEPSTSGPIFRHFRYGPPPSLLPCTGLPPGHRTSGSQRMRATTSLPRMRGLATFASTEIVTSGPTSLPPVTASPLLPVPISSLPVLHLTSGSTSTRLLPEPAPAPAILLNASSLQGTPLTPTFWTLPRRCRRTFSMLPDAGTPPPPHSRPTCDPWAPPSCPKLLVPFSHTGSPDLSVLFFFPHRFLHWTRAWPLPSPSTSPGRTRSPAPPWTYR